MVTNKHLLPVYNKPMIYHPLETLKSMGITDILVVTGGESIGDFMKLLGSGERIGVNLTYRIQEKPAGIAHALLFAEDFSRGEKVTVILGDNIFEKVEIDKDTVEKEDNAMIFLKEVGDSKRFGVAELDENGKVLSIEEKPEVPKSNYAVTGLYIYPPDVYDFIKTLKPSERGELEITDVNNHYIKNGRMRSVKVPGFWSDAGTFPSLMRSSSFLWANDKSSSEK
jgi:glucose-1-phosphate thymidylyltransferase